MQAAPRSPLSQLARLPPWLAAALRDACIVALAPAEHAEMISCVPMFWPFLEVPTDVTDSTPSLFLFGILLFYIVAGWAAGQGGGGAAACEPSTRAGCLVAWVRVIMVRMA